MQASCSKRQASEAKPKGSRRPAISALTSSGGRDCKTDLLSKRSWPEGGAEHEGADDARILPSKLVPTTAHSTVVSRRNGVGQIMAI